MPYSFFRFVRETIGQGFSRYDLSLSVDAGENTAVDAARRYKRQRGEETREAAQGKGEGTLGTLKGASFSDVLVGEGGV